MFTVLGRSITSHKNYWDICNLRIGAARNRRTVSVARGEVMAKAVAENAANCRLRLQNLIPAACRLPADRRPNSPCGGQCIGPRKHGGS
jgi:hypothetical protein